MFGLYREVSQFLDPTKQVVITPWGSQYHIDEFPKILPVSVIFDRHKYAQRIQTLGLTPQEEAVVRALAVVSPGM